MFANTHQGKIFKFLVPAIASFALVNTAFAQRQPGEEAFWSGFDESKKVKPLSFEKETKEFGPNLSFKNRVITPAGNGPFPVVVLMPSCAGVNDALDQRATEFIAAGFATLAVDSYAPRNKKWFDCANMFLPVMNDAADALKYLHTVDVVDKQRIFIAGWSTGAAGALFASSPSGIKENGTELRYRAAATHYANCMYQEGPKDVPAPVLRRDTDKPLLMLIAESDVPVSNCFPILEQMKAAGNPVEWHVMQGANHLWDRPDDKRGSRKNGFGQTILLNYNAQVTAEATQRNIDFFNRFK